MAPHSSILAWKPHGQRSLVSYIQSMGWQGVGQEWGTKQNRVQALFGSSQEGQQNHSILHLGRGGLSSCRTQRPVSDCSGGTRTAFYGWTIVSWLLFLGSSIPSLPLRSLITETCSGANIVARPRSPNGFSQESLAWFFKDHPTLSAYTPKLPLRVVNISTVSLRAATARFTYYGLAKYHTRYLPALWNQF